MGYVGNLYVDAPVQGRGVGRTLVRTVVEAAQERGYARIVVSPSPAAVRLFVSTGFITPGAAGPDALLVRGLGGPRP